jgi:hypothetical protein
MYKTISYNKGFGHLKLSLFQQEMKGGGTPSITARGYSYW